MRSVQLGPKLRSVDLSSGGCFCAFGSGGKSPIGTAAPRNTLKRLGVFSVASGEVLFENRNFCYELPSKRIKFSPCGHNLSFAVAKVH